VSPMCEFEIIALRAFPKSYEDFWLAGAAVTQPLTAFNTLGFARSVDAEIEPVTVVVAKRAGMITALLPLHVGRTRLERALGIAHRLGGPLSDAFEVIRAAGESADLSVLLHSARIRAMPFSHLIESQCRLTDADTVEGTRIGIGQGFEAYWAMLLRNRHKFAKDLERRRARLCRERGRIDLQWHCDSPQALQRLIEAKIAQYERSGHTDHPLRCTKARRLLFRLLANVASADCAPVLSVLRAGG
jgi:hypothetical protein